MQLLFLLSLKYFAKETIFIQFILDLYKLKPTSVELKTGAFVALSWPDTRIRNASSWYDVPMKVIGICKKDGYYHVGHAALLLIDYRNGDVRYFDFGRYHTPLGFGRVRDIQSDPELEINTKAIIEEGKIVNIEDILHELDHNKSTHGDGKLVCSVTPNIDFDLAVASAKSIQGREAVPYGPFQPFGSNCSRFVAAIYKSGFTSFSKKIRISNRYLYFHSPTSNIIYTHSKGNVFIIENGEFRVEESMMNIFLNKSKFKESEDKKTVKTQLPNNTRKLSGVGGDTYFQIERTQKSHLLKIRRYSEYGDLEIDDIYQLQTLGFDMNKPYDLTYISNGINVKVIQNNKIFVLRNVKYLNQKPMQVTSIRKKLFGRG